MKNKLSEFAHWFEQNEKLIIVNCLNPRPFSVSKGKDYILDYIKNEKNHDEQLNQILLEHGIFYNEKDFKPEFSEDSHKSFSIYLLIDQNCNMSCKYCLAGEKTYRKNDKMDLLIAKESLRKASLVVSNNNILEIIFFGGEPLLNQNLIFEITSFVENELKNEFPKIKYHYHITTNLTILNDKLINLFKELNFTVLTDIDGLKETHDVLRPFTNGKSTYDITLNNLIQLQQNNISVSVRCTLTSSTDDNLSEIYEDFKSKGLRNQSYPMLVPVNSDGTIIDSSLYPDKGRIKQFVKEKFLQSLKEHIYLAPFTDIAKQVIIGSNQKYGCGMPSGNTAVVDSSGLVYPCIYLVGNEKYMLGKINDLRNPFVFELESMNVNNLHLCKGCKIRFICGGGCPLQELLVKDNSIDSYKYFHETTCEMSWAAFEESCFALCENIVEKEFVTNTISIC